MIPYGRSAILSGYVEVAQSVGLNPYQMARQVGLDPACLTESELKVPIRLVRQLLEESARQSRVENFGLRMAKTRRLSSRFFSHASILGTHKISHLYD